LNSGAKSSAREGRAMVTKTTSAAPLAPAQASPERWLRTTLLVQVTDPPAGGRMIQIDRTAVTFRVVLYLRPRAVAALRRLVLAGFGVWLLLHPWLRPVVDVLRAWLGV